MQEFLKNKTRKAQRTNQTSFFKEVLENSPVPLGKDCTWTELKNMENIWVWWQPEQGSHCTEDELALLAPRSTRAVALHRWICESCKGEWSDVSSCSRGPAEQRWENKYVSAGCQQGMRDASWTSGDGGRDPNSYTSKTTESMGAEMAGRASMSRKGNHIQTFPSWHFFPSLVLYDPVTLSFLSERLNILKLNFWFKSPAIFLQKLIAGERLGRFAPNLWSLQYCQKYQETSSAMTHET